MRGKQLKILGKTFPAWAVAAALIVATAGAATGVVLAGKVSGTITATVSQALVVLQNAGTGVTGADASLVTVQDDGTAFQAAAEINTGDMFTVHLHLANLSAAELTGEVTLVAPDGITLSMQRADEVIPDVVRTGPFTWKFRMIPSGTPPNGITDLRINVALADDMPPGFYAVDGHIKQVAK